MWSQIETVVSFRGSDPVTSISTSGTSSRVKAEITESTGSWGATFLGSLDKTNFSGNLTIRSGGAAIAASNGVHDLPVWPYYKFNNISSGSIGCTITYWEWIEEEELDA